MKSYTIAEIGIVVTLFVAICVTLYALVGRDFFGFMRSMALPFGVIAFLVLMVLAWFKIGERFGDGNTGRKRRLQWR
jgi:purine-cytosine permease-like protein